MELGRECKQYWDQYRVKKHNQMISYEIHQIYGNDKCLLTINKRTDTFISAEGNVAQKTAYDLMNSYNSWESCCT